MTPEQRLLLALVLIPALLALHRFSGHLSQRPPLRLPLVALLALATQAWLAKIWPQAPGLIWLNASADLLSAYGLIQMGLWLLVLPAVLGGWRQPPRIVQDLLMLGLAALATVVLLRERAGVNLVGLITTSAVLTAVIGLAAQATLKDLLAGVSLQLGRPFQEGDWLVLEHGTGLVESVTLMNTVLRGVDGAQILIPNALMGQSPLQRFRPTDAAGVPLQLSLASSLPPAQALDLLRQVLSQHPRVLRTPPPEVWLEAYGDSAIHYQLMAWQRNAIDLNPLELRSELLSQIWYALERAGQALPYPVQEWRPYGQGLARAAGHASPHLLSRAERAQLLANNPLFSQLDPGPRQQLADLSRCLRFGPGETVLREGDAGDSLYQVVRGELEVIRGSATGEQQPVARLQPGAVVGEMALFSGSPRSATVRACAETIVLEVERRDLLPLIEADPTLLERLAHLVSQRQAELEQISAAAADRQERSLRQRMRQLFETLARGEDR